MPGRWNLDLIEAGQAASFTKTIGEADLVLFAGVSGDTHPFYLDEEYARATRFGGRIAPPALVIGLMHAAFSAQLPNMDGVVTEASYRFFAPLRLGDTATAEATVEGVDREAKRVVLILTCANQNGGPIADGRVVLLPAPEEIEVEA